MGDSFAKWHGYGNDFVILELGSFPEGNLGAVAKRVCRPHIGVGADGCIFVGKRSEREFTLRIFNQDGSEAGMSGNGARCAAAQIHRSGKSASSEVVLHTPSGRKSYRLLEQLGPARWRYRSDLGQPSFEPARVPCLVTDVEIVSEYPLEVEGRTLLINALSVGNPQCAILVEKLPEEAELATLGPLLEQNLLFPERVNVSFVRVADRQSLEIRIWERGVGATTSSGTGCCGAAVTALRLGLVDTPVRVETEAGFQMIDWSPGQEMILIGDVELVMDGTWYASEQVSEAGGASVD